MTLHCCHDVSAHSGARTARRQALLAIALLGVLCWPTAAAADTVRLQWDLSPEPEVIGYYLYVGTQSHTYTQTIDVQNTNTYSFTGAQPGQRYYFVIAAYTGSVVSGYSNEVSTVTNAYPVLTNPGGQTTLVGQAVTLTLSANDPEGAPLGFSASGLPSGLGISPTLGVISGAPTAPGTYSVTATVSDSVLSAQQTFSWVVQAQPANSPPTLVDPGPMSSTVGQFAVLQLQGADPDGNPLTYSASGLPNGLTVAQGTGLVSGTLTTPGTFAVTATVSDGTLSASRSFTWTVAALNSAPTLALVGDQSSTMGQPVTLQLQGSDVDGDTLTYSTSGLPPDLVLGQSTGLISGTPTTPGTFPVTVTVSDGVLSASRSFTWSVVVGNAAPTLAFVANQSGTVGQATSLQLQGADANGDALTYSASGLPPGLTIAQGTGVIAGTPTTAGGAYAVTATVSDGGLTASRSFTWTILAANVAPTLAVVANQSGAVGQAASLQLQGADANNDTLTYSASGLPPGLTIAPGTGLIAGTPTTAGAFTVTAAVSDGALSASRSFTWTIVAANVAPTLAVVANQSGMVGQAASLQLQGADANGNTLTYSASGLPPGLTIAAGTGLIAGAPTTAGAFTVTAAVSDGALSASRSFTWTIATSTATVTADSADATTKAARRHLKDGSSVTGTTATARPASTTTTTTKTPKRSPSGTTSSGTTTTTDTSLDYTGSTAIVRALVGADNSPLRSGTPAMLSDRGTIFTGTLSTSSTTTRAIVTDPLTADQPAEPVSNGADAGTSQTATSNAAATTQTFIAAPSIRIDTPVQDAQFAAGASVIFIGVARGADGSDLGSRITWTSDRDGVIGTGGLLNKVLSAGSHVITASVTDSGGRTSSAQVSVRVAQ